MPYLIYSCTCILGTTEEDMSILNIHDETLSPPNTPDIEKDGGKRADADHDSPRKSSSLSDSRSSMSSSVSNPKVTTVNKYQVTCGCAVTVNYMYEPC